MKRARRILSLMLLLCVMLGCFSHPVLASRDLSEAESMAGVLKELGLFKGVSDTDFDLGRAPTRVEALVMLIRTLGKEAEATSKDRRHPFTDVPAWADRYVGYAYQEGLTNGVSATEFGSSDASCAMYLTFILRALGYADGEDKDFVWSDPYSLAERIGILPESVERTTFWRADAVIVSYAALPVALKGTAQTLAEKLMAAGVFNETKYETVYNGAEPVVAESPENPASVPETTAADLPVLDAEAIYKKCYPAVFYIEVYDTLGNATASGSGFFIRSDGTAVTNFHVIQFASSAKIMLTDGEEVHAVTGVLDYNIEEDWAILQVEGSGFPYLELGAKDTIVSGAAVYAIGSPIGLNDTISHGIISNPKRSSDGIDYIQMTAPISSGSSGGALINKYGQVIGITSASYIYGQNMNLAIPLSYLNLAPAADHPVTLSALMQDVAKRYPLDYLASWLTRYGEYQKDISSNEIDEYYELTVSDYEELMEIQIHYHPGDGRLYLTRNEYVEEGDYLIELLSTILFLDGPIQYEDGFYEAQFFAFNEDSYEWDTYGYGYFRAEDMRTTYDFTFDEYDSGFLDEPTAKEACVYMLVGMLGDLDPVFDYFELLIDVADLGFTGIDYVSQLHF